MVARVARQQPALAALVVVCLAATIRYETFLTPENLANVLRQNSMAGLLALGMGVAILSGGLDLSVGAMLAVGAVTAAALSGHGLAVAAIGAAGAAAAVGAINGLIISKAGVPPFVATLVTGMAARGVLLTMTGEASVKLAAGSAGLKWLGRGWVGPVPVPALVLFGATAVVGVMLARTRFGRHVYAVGDDPDAARLLGLNVDRVLVGAYALSAGLAGLAGAVLAARVGVGQPTAGYGWELAAITAFVLGATSLGGRPAGAGSTLVGVLLLAVIFNAFNLEGSIPAHWQWVLRGAFLVGVVALQNRLAR